MNVRNWLIFTSKRLALVKDSKYPAKFKSLSLRHKTSTPNGVDVFAVEGFEKLNATRMSVAGAGWTAPNNYLRTAQMQTNPSHSAKTNHILMGVVCFILVDQS